MSVIEGEVFDVAVDIRRGSPTFARWVGVSLSGENKKQLCVPAGFAHGFCVASEDAVFSYKCADFYHPECEATVLWNDPEIGSEWPVANPTVSEKDAQGSSLKELDPEICPTFQSE